jgi:hypothetical protein
VLNRALMVMQRAVVGELNEIALANRVQQQHKFARRKRTRGHAAIMRPYNCGE